MTGPIPDLGKLRGLRRGWRIAVHERVGKERKTRVVADVTDESSPLVALALVVARIPPPERASIVAFEIVKGSEVAGPVNGVQLVTPSG